MKEQEIKNALNINLFVDCVNAHKTETKRGVCSDKLRRRHSGVGLLEAQRVEAV